MTLWTLDSVRASPINEILTNSGSMKIMPSIHLTCGFWQILLQVSCRDYTRFLYKERCYWFTVTLFELKMSLASVDWMWLSQKIHHNLNRLLSLYLQEHWRIFISLGTIIKKFKQSKLDWEFFINLSFLGKKLII